MRVSGQHGVGPVEDERTKLQGQVQSWVPAMTEGATDDAGGAISAPSSTWHTLHCEYGTGSWAVIDGTLTVRTANGSKTTQLGESTPESLARVDHPIDATQRVQLALPWPSRSEPSRLASRRLVAAGVEQAFPAVPPSRCRDRRSRPGAVGTLLSRLMTITDLE